MLDELKVQIRALFPIGSEWYDCLRDEVGTVVFHFPPRGIVLVRRFTATHLDRTRDPEKRDHVEIMKYGYSDLLDGLLVKPAGSSEGSRELFHGYRRRQEEISREFERMREEAGLADAECWGHPVL